MTPASILSYYPTYSILDEVCNNTGAKELNIFVDLRNAMQTLYMRDTIFCIVENSLKSKFIDTSVFSSILSFLSFHKLYSIKRNIKIRFYFFFESGTSYYHQNISRKYKVSRRVDDLYGLEREKRELFYEVVQKNLQLIEKAGNRLPNVKVIRMQNLEADFIPYYMLKNKLIPDDSTSIIYSNDHDLLQSIINEKVYVFFKSAYNKKLIRKNEVMNSCWKFKKSIPDEYLPLSMSIVGDQGDDVYGVNGIGSKRISEIIREVLDLIADGSVDNLYNKVFNNEDLFNITSHKNKYINKIIEEELSYKKISNNLKLVSFELISRALDEPINTEMTKKKNYLFEILDNNNIVDKESIKEALIRNRVYLDDDSLETIYYGEL